MTFKVTEILPNVLHFNFRSYRTMVRHFLRFQEYWENPHFRNKIFTHKEYKDWYLQQHDSYDIEVSWAGCAVSEKAFEPFFNKQFKPNDKEKAVLEVVKHLRGDRFFVITSVGNDQDTVLHETAHAMYGMNAQYRKQVKSILESTLSAKTRDFLNTELSKMEYGPLRFDDELHAYLMEGITKFIELTGNRSKYTPQIRKQFKLATQRLRWNFKQSYDQEER